MRDRPLRLLLLTSDYSPGNWSGVGVAVAGQAKALACLGHDVHVAVADDLKTQKWSPGLWANQGPLVHALGRRRFPLDPSTFDAVHLHSIRLAPIALELQRRFGLPLITTVHGFIEREMAGTSDSGATDSVDLRPWITLQRQVLAASDQVVVLSTSEAELVAEMRLPAQRLCTIGNGAETSDLASFSQPQASSQPAPIVFAGRFARSKGIGLAQRLALRLVSEGAATVVFAGGHGDVAGVRALGDLKGLEGHGFVAPGWLPRPRLRALYRRASLVIVPSRYEPFGLTALEAQAAGVPVLASDVGGLRQTVASSSRLASRHADDWASAAMDLLRDRQRVRERVQLGRQNIAGFTWQRVAERLADEVYSPVASSRKGTQ